jgi:hypothetical protein
MLDSAMMKHPLKKRGVNLEHRGEKGKPDLGKVRARTKS